MFVFYMQSYIYKQPKLSQNYDLYHQEFHKAPLFGLYPRTVKFKYVGRRVNETK